MIKNREHKVVHASGKIYLYPFPVIKDEKYLIECESEIFSQKLMGLLNKNLFPNPLENNLTYEMTCLHTDQKTRIFRPLRSEHYPILGKRSINPTKAEVVEKVLIKKIMAYLFMEQEGSKDEMMRTYQKQLNCSECQKMGINDLKVSEI